MKSSAQLPLASAADRYLGEAFIPRSQSIRLIGSLHLEPGGGGLVVESELPARRGGDTAADTPGNDICWAFFGRGFIFLSVSSSLRLHRCFLFRPVRITTSDSE